MDCVSFCYYHHHFILGCSPVSHVSHTSHITHTPQMLPSARNAQVRRVYVVTVAAASAMGGTQNAEQGEHVEQMHAKLECARDLAKRPLLICDADDVPGGDDTLWRFHNGTRNNQLRMLQSATAYDMKYLNALIGIPEFVFPRCGARSTRRMDEQQYLWGVFSFGFPGLPRLLGMVLGPTISVAPGSAVAGRLLVELPDSAPTALRHHFTPTGTRAVIIVEFQSSAGDDLLGEWGAGGAGEEGGTESKAEADTESEGATMVAWVHADHAYWHTGGRLDMMGARMFGQVGCVDDEDTVQSVKTNPYEMLR